MKKIMISTDLNLKNHDSSIKKLEQKINHLAQLISTHNHKHALMPKIETFGEKVKRRILEENKEPTATHDKPKQQLQKVVSHEIKELPAHYSATLQNKLPSKETDPGSFILPCIIGNHSMSNALDDLGARIKENVIVKISNFMFPIDFIILDIIEDENVLIILSRPMLATAHAKIDVYEFDSLMDFENSLSPEYGSQDIISLSPSESIKIKEDFSMMPCDPDKRMSIGLEDFVDIDDMWDDLDLGILTYEEAKTEFLKSRINMVGLDKNLHVFIGNYQLLVDFIILENISEFVENGLTKVLFGQPFKEQIGLVEDRGKGTLWFKIGNDKTIFHMPRAEKAFRKLMVKQHNSMGPLLKVSEEDKKKRNP
ncbi:hypothetical protein Tco_0341631 [Tanacetum coccineum]